MSGYVYIYTLADPRDDVIRYIGYTRNLKRRIARHISDHNHNHRVRWIQSLLDAGVKPIAEVLETCLPGEDFKAKEIEWIAAYKRIGFDLVNGTDGGEGVEFSPEALEKMSAASKGRVHGPVSQEIRDKISASQKGRVLSQETRDKISASIRRVFSQETRDKISASKMGIARGPMSEETREKISDALYDYWSKKRSKQ